MWQADFLGCKEDVDSTKAEYSRWAAPSVEELLHSSTKAQPVLACKQAIEVYFSGEGKPLERVRKGDTSYKIKPNRVARRKTNGFFRVRR